MTSTFNAPMTPASITHAVAFLTRPLILNLTPSMVMDIKAVLITTLGACYNPLLDGGLTLTLSPNTLPPRPILAACIISGMRWVEWMKLLGGREFDLVVETQNVKVTYHGSNPQTVVVWSESASRALLARLVFGEPQVPISKLGRQSAMQAKLNATVNSAVARAKTRTVAQQLLESDQQEEADEIFAMISKSAIISPTPTREKFTFDLPKLVFTPSSPSPLSSPESSRPSSRSSTFSTFSFSSDDESNSSVSSASSFDFLASTKPSTFNKQAPAFVPHHQRAPRVFIDNTKKEVTKYLYQGGVSNVLTGGVMLGGPSTTAPAKASQVPKYRAPVGGKKYFPTQKAAFANSWRRSYRA